MKIYMCVISPSNKYYNKVYRIKNNTPKHITFANFSGCRYATDKARAVISNLVSVGELPKKCEGVYDKNSKLYRIHFIVPAL